MPQPKPPVAGLADDLLQQFVIGRVAAVGEEPLPVAHFESTRHAKPLAVLVRLQHQQRRVRRDNVKLLRQPDDLVLDELAAALLKQLIQVSSRPQSRNKRVALLGIFKRDPRGIPHLFSAARSRHHDLARLILTRRQITTDQNLLSSRGEIRQLLRVNRGHLNSLEFHIEVPQTWLGNFVEQFQRDRHRRLAAADRTNRTSTERRNRLQHDRLKAAARRDCVKSALRLLSVKPSHSRREFLRVHVASRDDAVSHVDDMSLLADVFLNRLKRRIQIRPAERHAIAQPGPRLIDFRVVRRNRLLEKPFRFRIADRHVEAVVRAERRKHGRNELGLRFSIGLVHRARRVTHKQNFERLAVGKHFPLPVALRRRRHELQHEVAVVTSPMRNRHDIGRSAVDVAYELEVARRRVFLRRKLDAGRPLGLLDPNRMRWRVNLLQRQRRIDEHVDRQFPQRRLQQHLASQRVRVPILVGPQWQHLCVDDLNSFFRVCLNREHTGLENVAACPLKQPRIAPFAQNRFVNLPGTLLLDDVRLDELATDPHSKSADRRVLRQRKMKNALQTRFRPIHKGLFDRRASDLVPDFHVDFVIPNRQRHVAAVDFGDERADRFVRRCSFKTEQPDRIFLNDLQLAISTDLIQSGVVFVRLH